jgi:hypothetical protein
MFTSFVTKIGKGIFQILITAEKPYVLNYRDEMKSYLPP